MQNVSNPLCRLGSSVIRTLPETDATYSPGIANDLGPRCRFGTQIEEGGLAGVSRLSSHSPFSPSFQAVEHARVRSAASFQQFPERSLTDALLDQVDLLQRDVEIVPCQSLILSGLFISSSRVCAWHTGQEQGKYLISSSLQVPRTSCISLPGKEGVCRRVE